jgi:uncharacterized membrane protein
VTPKHPPGPPMTLGNMRELGVHLHGVFTTIDVPGSVNTTLSSINASGQIVGRYLDSSNHSHGFLDDHGVFTTIDVPGSVNTIAFGINVKGQIVGTYEDSSAHLHGFLDDHGVFTTIDVPGSVNTEASGFNVKGQIVGSYDDSSGQTHGFVATPIHGADPVNVVGVNPAATQVELPLV